MADHGHDSTGGEPELTELDRVHSDRLGGDRPAARPTGHGVRRVQMAGGTLHRQVGAVR